MSTLAVPLNFGHRQCDRLLVRSLAPKVERDSVLWKALLIWQDYATAREDRRQVPADPAARATCAAVAILEEFIGWEGESGGFVEPAIQSGFFMLTPVSEHVSDLVLTDFFPANASAVRVTNAQAGGVGRSMNKIAERAEIAASDQLKLFERDGSLPQMDANRARAALKLIHSICLALKRQSPVDDTWKNTLIPLAAEVIREVPAHERDCVLRWFIANRQDQRIPLRLDFVLQQFKTFIPEALAAFGR